MADEVVVLVPALARPWRVEATLESLYASQEAAQLRLLYLLSPEDTAQQEAVQRAEVEYRVMAFPATKGDYAKKMNAGVTITDEEWLFLAADDLKFWPGWADSAIRCSRETGALVIGTNDLGNPQVKRGIHSTHTLVHRSYVERGTADDHGRLLHEGYHHNWVDAEFVETAKQRGQFTHARGSIVEHLHPHWRKSKMDETYKLGLSRYDEDRLLYRQRERLWKQANLGSRTPQKGVSHGGR